MVVLKEISLEVECVCPKQTNVHCTRLVQKTHTNALEKMPYNIILPIVIDLRNNLVLIQKIKKPSSNIKETVLC